MIEETVPCRTLDEVLEEHGVRNVDVLVIDTEGYDAEILHGIDFRRFKPQISRFEHALPSAVMSRETFSKVVRPAAPKRLRAGTGTLRRNRLPTRADSGELSCPAQHGFLVDDMTTVRRR
jgi:hypothetical protein